jgi:hypothetical protein
LMQDRYRHLDENLLQRTAGPYIGSKGDIPAAFGHVRATPETGRRAFMRTRPSHVNLKFAT